MYKHYKTIMISNATDMSMKLNTAMSQQKYTIVVMNSLTELKPSEYSYTWFEIDVLVAKNLMELHDGVFENSQIKILQCPNL